MFDHIVLRRAEGGSPVSAGQLAEALLYYRHVHLFADIGTVAALVDQIGADTLLSLLRRPDVRADFDEWVAEVRKAVIEKLANGKVQL